MGSKGQKNYNRGVELISAINIQFIFKSIFLILFLRIYFMHVKSIQLVLYHLKVLNLFSTVFNLDRTIQFILNQNIQIESKYSI